jgi:hypothetical protein
MSLERDKVLMLFDQMRKPSLGKILKSSPQGALGVEAILRWCRCAVEGMWVGGVEGMRLEWKESEESGESVEAV